MTGISLALVQGMSVNPTKITITPPPPAKELGAPIFGVRTPGDTDSFAAGVSDLVDIINPLHHIPFVSHLYEEASGDKASGVAKLIGGGLLGGPIGFFIALGNVIFEQQTGHSMAGAAIASITGSDGPIAAKSSEVASNAYEKAVAAAPADTIEILPPEKSASLANDKYAARAQDTQMQLASAVADIGGTPEIYTDKKQREEDAQVLALFGGQSTSAHRSYKQAQMLPYLEDVTTSLVM